MTDNEIINVVEWVVNCNGGNVVDCIGCPLAEFYPCCEEKALEFALDLITRLQAENEALIAGQETLQKYIAEQKAEIERLQNELDIRPPASASYLFKKAELDEMLIRAIGAEEAYKAKIKAEAIKEFAERLEGEQLFLSGCVPWYDIQNKISWIAKEMDQSQK